MNILTDLVNAVTAAQVFAPQVVTGSSAINGTVKDLGTASTRFQEFAIVQTGTLVDGSYVVKLQQGDSSAGSDAADISGATTSLASTDDSVVKYIPFYRANRYVRAVVTPTSASTGGPITVLVLAQSHRPGATNLVP